jgi:hypothetical protein
MTTQINRLLAGLPDKHRAEVLRAAAVGAAAVYLIGVTAYLLRQGSWPTPDFLIPPLVLIAILMGRGWTFVIDWAPFLLLILVYEGFRGIADDLNARVHVEALISADRWLTGGSVPTLTLQKHLYHVGHVTWYDWLAAALHVAHFVVPVALGFGIWLNNRALYWRYVVAVIGLFFAGFITYVAYPAAPPWLAFEMGFLPPIHRVLDSTLSSIATGNGLTLAYHDFSPNPVAALPSLHAGVPMLVSFIVMSLWGRRALPVLLYPLLGGLAWIYLGEHYLVDVLAGWLYAAGAFVLFWVLPPVALPALIPRLHLEKYGRMPPSKPWPAWPLAVTALLAGAYFWLNMAVQPLSQVTPVPIQQPSADLATSAPVLDDLGLVSCGSGTSTLSMPDDTLEAYASKYAGFIQGVDSGTCYTFTAVRDFEPLSDGELTEIQSAIAAGTGDILASWSSQGMTYVSLGPPSDDLLSLEDISDQEVYVVVVRVDNEDNEDALERFLAQLAGIALKIQRHN